jgi:DNA repair exonuclease SbcCD ATPase subunit
LDIFIQHKDQNARPLELGSGAEKTLAAMAIRIALLNVSNMPKSDIMCLDEPATALDADNMEGFTRVLDMSREHFKTTLLITHIDSLKDNVDKVIPIQAKDGFAFVEE